MGAFEIFLSYFKAHSVKGNEFYQEDLCADGIGGVEEN